MALEKASHSVYFQSIYLQRAEPSLSKLTHEEISRKRVPKEQAHTVERLPIYGLLDNIRSLYNVGSIFRSSDGALVSGLFLCGYTPTPPRKEINKTALGATETVPWQYFKNPVDATLAAQNAGARICVLEHTTISKPYYDMAKIDFPLCLVVGNELTGVSPEIVRIADLAIEIPMYGTKQSLNAAVAYGIALYDLVRVYRTGK